MIQLVSAIPRSWKDVIKQITNKADDCLTYNHHTIWGSRILTVDKLTSRELYCYLVSTIKTFSHVLWEFAQVRFDID